MATERICDVCGVKKKLEGGKTCENGHFICYTDRNTGFFGGGGKTVCPICKAPLR
jgi:hypothetical protein